MVRACVTDDDYEAWRAVRISVLPYERCDTLAELRAKNSEIRLLALAEIDGTVVGSGMANRSDSQGAGSVAPRVVPDSRRRGVGSALLEVLCDHCVGLGFAEVRAKVDDEESLAFATHFGFVEVDREVEQVRAIGDERPPTGLPAGVEVVTLAERPELWGACYETFGRQVLADFAVTTPLDVSADGWRRGGWSGEPMFLAVHDGEVIGCAGLNLDDDRSDRAENALTAVRRDWRGRGLAAHLKQHTLHWAAGHGIREVYTWTQAGNVAMRRLNEKLGYADGHASVTVSRALPLEGSPAGG